MAKRHERITPDDVPRLLATLACGDDEAQQHTLRLLCPCRNRVYDPEVWIAIFRAYDSSMDDRDPVRHQAKHAIDTLRQRAVTDPLAQEFVAALAQQGIYLSALEDAVPAKRRERRITSRDVPRLLDTLDCGDPAAQQHTLHLLCPCRNRRYDKEVWLAIFRAYESADSGAAVRDQAVHAIETLRGRARTDPRSQELLRWLSEQGVMATPVETIVPIWNPRPRDGAPGLSIPRWKHSPRSKANRRR